jgi:hypothetical protein
MSTSHTVLWRCRFLCSRIVIMYGWLNLLIILLLLQLLRILNILNINSCCSSGRLTIIHICEHMLAILRSSGLWWTLIILLQLLLLRKLVSDVPWLERVKRTIAIISIIAHILSLLLWKWWLISYHDIMLTTPSWGSSLLTCIITLLGKSDNLEELLIHFQRWKVLNYLRFITNPAVVLTYYSNHE